MCVGLAKTVIRKTPLTFVPVISELFSKINIDAVGSLPASKSGNKYILTALGMFSKYPETVVVMNISSLSVNDAFFQIFSPIGVFISVFLLIKKPPSSVH
ncbi:hypothetical protein CEXT_77871 [Caerostris extrusa]|uniref:Uncharacterized protein n=1 Tax=Caerostris extrusa TaxID=172846 RepID=A0AAV4U5P3_CAEEX|nr:hypothetical protein CEXT_77871 [Caerostris extrusa]